MAVPHYTYLVLKMPGPRGIITVKGSFEVSDLCDKEFHKMAQNFGMIANYGDKAKNVNAEGINPLEGCAMEPEAKKLRAEAPEEGNSAGGEGKAATS
jgi:hypothetical protein